MSKMSDSATQQCGCRERAPEGYDGVNLREEGCPVCDCWDFTEWPAGYYHCDDCGSEWSGDAEDATLVHFFTPEEA